MFCTNCGANVQEDAKFCTACGQVQPEPVAEVQEKITEVTEAAKTEVAEVAKIDVGEAVKTEVAKAFVKPAESGPAAFNPVPSVTPKPIPAPAPEPAAAPIPEAASAPEPAIAPAPTPIPNPAPVPAPAGNEKKTGFKPMYLVALAVIALVIFAAVKFIPGGGSGKAAVEHLVQTTDDGSIILSSKYAPIEIDGEVRSFTQSLDGTAAAYLKDYSYSYGGTLIYIVNGKAQEVAEDVMGFKLSQDGSTLAYLTEEYDYDYAELYVYSSGNSKLVSDEAYNEIEGIVLSPDGKTICYPVYDNGDINGFISVNGKTAEAIGKNRVCIAVANGGRYRYIADDRNGLYVSNGKDETKIGNNPETLMFNSALNEVMVVIDAKTYICVNGGDKVRLANEYMYPVLPGNTSIKYESGSFGIYPGSYAIASFKDQLAYSYTGECIYYINSKYEAVKTVSQVAGSVFVSDDGKRVVYAAENGSVCLCENAKSADSESVVLQKRAGVYWLNASQNLSSVYYVNYDDELMYISGKAEAKFVADYLDGYMAFSADGKTAYYTSDYELFMTTNGGKPVKVKASDDVEGLMNIGDRIYCYIYAGGSSYDLYEVNGSKLTKVAEEVYKY